MSNTKKTFNKLLNVDRRLKRSLQIIVDFHIIFVALTLANVAVSGSTIFLIEQDFFLHFCLTAIPTILVLVRFGLYRDFIRYFSTHILTIIGAGSLTSAGVLVFSNVLLGQPTSYSVAFVYAAFLFIGITCRRQILRSIFQLPKTGDQEKIALYGAGIAGAQTIQALQSTGDHSVAIVIDDAKKLQGQTLFGVRIYSYEDALIKIEQLRIRRVLLAIPSVRTVLRSRIVSRLMQQSIEVKTIPSLASIIDGTSKIHEFKDFAIEELLGRDPVKPDSKLMRKTVFGQTVLVTGAGGSIGSELCRQIAIWRPKHIVLFDISEPAIYEISQELQNNKSVSGVKLTSVIGSIQDNDLIKRTLGLFSVDTIYHAAAYKHVPLMEQNIIECFKNNVFGTLRVAEQAVSANVKNFIMISTDKAVNPTNYMGSSKRVAELICQTFDEKQKTTRFALVRFGNVLGSSGSVIPLFKKQIENGGPITLTHKDVTRFFMTITEAAQLVIQAGAMKSGPEIYVLDMGQPIKILDLAKKMIKLSGHNPSFETDDQAEPGDIAIEITGLRPGEKLYEELSYGSNLAKTQHPRIMVAQEETLSSRQLATLLKKLDLAVQRNDPKALTEVVVEITPSLAVKSN